MNVSPSHLSHARLKPLPLKAVQLDKGFWDNWQQRNHTTTIPHGYRMLEKSGTLNNMQMAAEQCAGASHEASEFRGYVFQDSDLYKWLEAASLSLAQHHDTELESNVQALISLLQRAQFPNGYLDSYFTIVKPEQEWTDLEWAHEMYCAGHLMEAGIARKRATGDADLLDIARGFADHIDASFGTGKRAGLCGHPEIELALVELYRETNEPRYLELARYFIDQRGHHTFAGLPNIGPLYMQDRVPIREAQSVEGHAVRQLYLCAGATDLYLETGEQALLDTMNRLWHDMRRGKMYITGGVGARGYGEMFGDAYELPTKEAYCETCAAIASMMWNWRMLLATGEVCFADALERVLYNGFLSGIALDGEHFLYENPLRSDGGYERQEWFACACCPPNVMRQLALVADYCATTNENGVQIHQYMNANIKSKMGDWSIETNYPWSGKIQLTCERTGYFELALRIPGWRKRGYIKLDGRQFEARGGAYARFMQEWAKGDIVELNLPMSPHFVQAHPYVDAIRGSVAIERGPLVYCIEQIDQHADVNDLRVKAEGKLRAEWRDDICGGVMTIRAEGNVFNTGAWGNDLYREAGRENQVLEHTEITAVPYFAWGNRGADKMRVWVPLA